MSTSRSGHIEHVHDGNTVTFSHGYSVLSVRLWGVDCPEIDQPFGTAATKAARQFAEGEAATLELKNVDDDRLVGRVHIADTTLGAHLTKKGLAWHSRESTTSDELKTLEQNARTAERGLWTQDAPTPPWKHRRRLADTSTEEVIKDLLPFILGFIGTLILVLLLAL